MWQKKVFSITIAAFLFYQCKHEHDHEEKYSCSINGADLAVSGANFARANCENLPPEGIKVKVNNLVVPSGQIFALRFFTDPNVSSANINDTSGIEVRWDNTQLFADFAGGENFSANPHGGANSFCIEIHDLTKEKHVQIYSGSECSGTLLLNHSESTAPTPSTRGMSYRRSDNSVTVGNISLEGDKDGHQH